MSLKCQDLKQVEGDISRNSGPRHATEKSEQSEQISWINNRFGWNSCASTQPHRMSGRSETAASRRSSVVYDPARDIFQPMPDALSAVTEENVQTSAIKEACLPTNQICVR